MLITISGVDGSGKSTQARLLARRLEERGHCCELIWYRPGYSHTLDVLRASVRRLSPGVLPEIHTAPRARAEVFQRSSVRKAWITVALFDTLVQYAFRVRALRSLGRIVICDRYLHDGALDLELRFPDEGPSIQLAYSAVRRLCPIPDVCLALTLPMDEVRQRRAQKREPFPDDEVVSARRTSAYGRLIAEGAVRPVDASGSLEEVHGRIMAAVDEAAAT